MKTKKTEIVIKRRNLLKRLKSILQYLFFSFSILFIISLLSGDFDEYGQNNIVCLDNILTDYCYEGLNRTYNYSQIFGEPHYFTKNANYELNDEIKNVMLHKILNFHMPLILIEKLILFVGLAILLFFIRKLASILRNSFSVKIE